MTPTKSNIQAARDLVKRYREITINEIKECHKLGYVFTRLSFKSIIATKLTGFGQSDKCPLCNHTHCSECIYKRPYGCSSGDNKKTYKAIRYASTPTILRNAYRKRADHIEKILNNTNPS